MPRGLPDYYNPDTIVSQRLANVEEVVTAIRKIGSIDNRGRTLFIDDFNEDLAGWVVSSEDAAADPVLSTGQAFIPPAAVYLDAGDTGGDDNSKLTKIIQLGASARIGFELSYWYHSDAPMLQAEIRYDLAGDDYFAYLSVTPADGAVRIWSSAGWTTICNVGYNAWSEGAWLPLKFVADFETGEYVRLLVGQEEYDISAYVLMSTILAVAGRAEFRLICYPTGEGADTGYIGHAVGTVDEP